MWNIFSLCQKYTIRTIKRDRVPEKPNNTKKYIRIMGNTSNLPITEMDISSDKTDSPILTEKLINPPLILSTDYLFTSNWSGGFAQQNLKNFKVQKQFFNENQKTGIWNIKLTHNKKFLFTSDEAGNVKQWSVKKQSLLKNYKVPLSKSLQYINVRCLLTSPDDEFLFIASGSNVYQYNISKSKQVQTHKTSDQKSIVHYITCTFNNKYLFIGDNQGYQCQICLVTNTKVISVKICGTSIARCVVTSDDEFLYVSSNGYIKKWDIEKRCLANLKCDLKLCPHDIWSMALSKDNRYIYATGLGPYFKKIDTNDQKEVEDIASNDLNNFTKENCGVPFSLQMDHNKGLLYIGDSFDGVRQYNVNTGLVVRFYPKIFYPRTFATNKSETLYAITI